MRIAFASALCLIATIACAEQGDAPFWTPSQADVAHVEAIVQLPDEMPVLHLGKSVRMPPKEIKSYSRFYAGITVKGRRTIHGIYLHHAGDQPPGIYIVGEKQIPAIADGGCNVIEFFYDVTADKMTSILCNISP